MTAGLAQIGGRQAALEDCCAPKALGVGVQDHLGAIAVGTAVLAAVVGIAVLLVRRLLIRRALTHRVEYELLPTTSFDPTPEDVSRFAVSLTRVRPAESRMRPRQGASARLAMGTYPSGKLLLTLSGPRSAESVLRHQSYPQVELKKPRAAEYPHG